MSRIPAKVLIGLLLLFAAFGAFAQSNANSTQQPQADKSKKPSKEEAKAIEEMKALKSVLPMTILENGLHTYLPEDRLRIFSTVPPASCAEWAVIPGSLPPTVLVPNCKDLHSENKTCCFRCQGTQAGTFTIGPIEGQTRVGQPITVHFKFTHLGQGDYDIYQFGKVDWGDNSQQGLVAWNQDDAATHTYTASKTYIIHAMGGAQFKWQGGGGGTETSCSYECCTDASIQVTVTP